MKVDGVTYRAADIRELLAENDRLRNVIGNPEMLRVEMDKSGWRMDLKHWAVRLLAGSFADSLGDAPNYLTCELVSEKTGKLAVTIQRCGGKTPSEIQKELQQEIALLYAENYRLKEGGA